MEHRMTRARTQHSSCVTMPRFSDPFARKSCASPGLITFVHAVKYDPPSNCCPIFACDGTLPVLSSEDVWRNVRRRALIPQPPASASDFSVQPDAAAPLHGRKCDLGNGAWLVTAAGEAPPRRAESLAKPESDPTVRQLLDRR